VLTMNDSSSASSTSPSSPAGQHASSNNNKQHIGTTTGIISGNNVASAGGGSHDITTTAGYKQHYRTGSAGAYQYQYGSTGRDTRDQQQAALNSVASFLPYHKLYYGCINCTGIEDEDNDESNKNTTAAATGAGDDDSSSQQYKQRKNILFELRKLKSDDGMHHSSELVGVSISDTYAHLRSTCLSFRPTPPTSSRGNNSQNSNSAASVMHVQCATGLTNGSLCVHSLDIDTCAAAGAAASVVNHASLSFYPPKSARSCTAVAWRPSITKHVAIGLRSQRKMGRGDREFCCLVWDLEATHARTMLPSDGQTKAQAVHNSQAPVYRFAHNTDVSSLAWLLDGHVLAVGTHQRIQLYDVRMAATNTPPTSSFAHNDVVSGIEVDQARSNIFATFSEGAGEPVKLWDTRRMDSPTSEIKTSTFACRDDLSIISSIKWSTLSPGTLAIVSEDTIRTFDTLGNRPLLSRIMYSPSDIKCIAFQPSATYDCINNDDLSGATKMIYPRRLLTVTSGRKVNATPNFQSAPLSISARDGRIAHSFGNAVWTGSASIGPSAIEKTVPSHDEDISAVMMRRARCLHVASYSTDPASNLIMLSKEYSQDKSNGKGGASNNQELWRLWNWIERVEFLCEDAFELEESGEQSLWPVKSLVDAGATHLLHMDDEVDEGMKSESLQCITYDSPMRG